MDWIWYFCYTARFAEAVYVLHAFQKKSKSGIGTPKQEMELVRTRLHRAEEAHREFLKTAGGRP
ncbi:MAG: type II toxin-antitoxin system RelE/ParE family toxin [Tepidisphaerales bacterium]